VAREEEATAAADAAAEEDVARLLATPETTGINKTRGGTSPRFEATPPSAAR
jgi:hypothetical protein